MEQARAREPLKFWTPNGAQENAIKEIGSLENFIVVLAFANGVGKTAGVFAIMAAIMWGAPTSAFDYPLYKEYPKRWPKLVRIVTESALVSAMGPIQVESHKWWPKGRFEWVKAGKMHNSVFVTDTGFKGEVMTYEQALKEFEGKTVGVNLFIEPPPKEIFTASVARQRMGGLNIFDMTPLMNAAWVMDDIVAKPEIIVDGQVVGKSKCLHADIEENCIQHGKNGQLEHRDIQQIISRYDIDEIDARAHGKFMHLSGCIFKGFNRSRHVAPQELVPPAGSAIFQVVDPAIGKPIASIWAYVDATGQLAIYDESPDFNFEGAKDSGLTARDYADLFKEKERGKVIQTRIMDRHFGNKRQTLGGLSLKQEFSELGFDFTDSYALDPQVEVETGILKVKDYLAVDGLGRTKLVISPNCTNTIMALERWGRDPKTFKPKEDYKDFCDVVRYLAMANPEIDRQVNWTQTKQPFYGVGLNG